MNEVVRPSKQLKQMKIDKDEDSANKTPTSVIFCVKMETKHNKELLKTIFVLRCK